MTRGLRQTRLPIQTRSRSRDYHRRSFRPWARSVVLVTLLAAGVSWISHSRRAEALASIRRDIAESGGWTTLSEYFGAVEVDRALQEEFWDWNERWEFQSPPDEYYWIARDPNLPRPPEADDMAEANHPWLVEGLTLLERPGLILSAHGFTPLDWTGASKLYGENCRRTSSVSALRDLVRWIHFRSILSDGSADRWLRSLDRIDNGYAPCGKSWDAFLSRLFGWTRDETYLAAIVRRQVSPDLARAWLQAPSRVFTRYAEGMRGDRIFELIPFLDADLSTLVEAGGTRWRRSSADHPFMASCRNLATRIDWVLGRDEFARAIRAQYQLERRFSGESSISLAEIRASFRELTREVSNRSDFDLYSTCSSLFPFDNTHRALRIAARAYLHRRTHGELPQDQETLAARWPDLFVPEGDGLRLRYELENDCRFRVTVDWIATTPLLSAAEFASFAQGRPAAPRPAERLWIATGYDFQFRVPDWFE